MAIDYAGASVRMQMRERFEKTLREHWLTGIQCDEATGTDVASCYCAVWCSGRQPNVGAAVKAWVEHVMEQVR